MRESPGVRFPNGQAARGAATRRPANEVPPEYIGDVVVAEAYLSAVRRGDAYEAELRRQLLEAWMRADYVTASRIAKLIGDPDPIDHELEDLREHSSPVP